MHMIIITLTTTPPNFPHVHKTIRTLINQTVQPDRIILNIPSEYTREDFQDGLFDMHIAPTMDALRGRVEINRCHDYGPATKLLGLLEINEYGIFKIKESISDDDIVIVLDDDIEYPSELVETHKKYHSQHDSGTVFSVCCADISGEFIVNSNQVDKSEFDLSCGWGSYSMRGRMLNEDLLTAVHFPRSLRLSDDIFISNALTAHHNTCVIQTPSVNHNSMKILDHGNSSHQLHNSKSLGGGSHNWGNEYKYCKALAFLIKKNLLKIKMDTPTKKMILCRDLYYSFMDVLDESESDFVGRCMDQIKHNTVLESAQALDVERQKILKLQRFYKNVTGNTIPPSDFYSYMSLVQKEGYDGLSKAMDAKKTITNKVIVVFPHAVKLGGHGCQVRLFQTINFLVANKFDVHIFSKNGIKGHTWEQKDIDYLSDMGIKNIDIFDTTDPTNPEYQWSSYCTQKIKQMDYDFCVVVYSNTLHGNHLDQLPKDKLILELHDNMNVHEKIVKADHSCVDLPFVRQSHVARTDKDTLRKFGIVSCNSEIEHEELYPEINSVYIPNSVPTVVQDNTYSRNALFIASDNPFNCNAMKILDLGATFPLDIAGRICNDWGQRFVTKNNPCINSLGYLESLSEVYRHAPFTVCPIIFGTGSKVKIEESLSCGVPVVAMIDSGLPSSIIDGVNGFLCYSFKEFFECCSMLDADRQRCKKMGENARLISQADKDCHTQYDHIFNTYY